MEAEKVFGGSVGELHPENDLRIRINSGAVFSDRNLVGESGDGCGEDLSARGPPARQSGEGDEDDPAHQKRDAGEPGHARQESPAHHFLSNAMLLGLPPEVPNDKREGSQHDVADKSQSKEHTGPVGS